MSVWLSACSPDEPKGVYVDASKVSAGECFWRQYPEAEVWSIVKVVSCEGDEWQFAVVSRFVIAAGGPFPA